MDDNNFYYEPLTERELEVLQLKIARHKNAEIANQLYVTKNTVSWYVRQIYGKLYIEPPRNVKKLTKRVEELGLLDEPDKKDKSPPPSNLPNPFTSFIGREQEIDDIRKWLTKKTIGDTHRYRRNGQNSSSNKGS